MEIEYVTVGLDPQVTEYIVEEADAETSISPTHVKTESDQDFYENNSRVSCPTLATEQIKLESDAGCYEHTYVYLDQNSVSTAHTQTSPRQDIYDTKEVQPAEVLYQIKDDMEESDSEVLRRGRIHAKGKKELKKQEKKQPRNKRKPHSAPTESHLADAGLLLGQGGVHAGFNSYICTECGKSFRGKESLRKHLQSHRQDWLHACIKCKQKFPDRGSLLKHVQCEHTHNNEYHCCLCGMRFQAENAFARHMRIHSGEGLFICSVCGKNFCHRSSLSRHQHTHRLEKEDSLIRCSSSSSTSSISSSSSSTSSSTSSSSSRTIPPPIPSPKLVIHERTTAPKSFLCVKCGKRFNHSSSLSRHRLTHLEVKKTSPRSTKVQKNTAKRSVEQGKPFMCANCNKDFAHSSSLRRHMLTHEQRPYQCSLCHKGFLKLAALSSHQRCHQDRKSFQDRKVHSCFECGKSFSHSSSLSRHRHTHLQVLAPQQSVPAGPYVGTNSYSLFQSSVDAVPSLTEKLVIKP